MSIDRDPMDISDKGCPDSLSFLTSRERAMLDLFWEKAEEVSRRYGSLGKGNRALFLEELRAKVQKGLERLRTVE